jgi:DNA-binding IclR family transcriptional regulator
LRILAWFAEKDQWALNELARDFNLPLASMHGLLGLCRPQGFVMRDEDVLNKPDFRFDPSRKNFLLDVLKKGQLGENTTLRKAG